MHLLHVVGARPNFVKAAPVLAAQRGEPLRICVANGVRAHLPAGTVPGAVGRRAAAAGGYRTGTGMARARIPASDGWPVPGCT